MKQCRISALLIAIIATLPSLIHAQDAKTMVASYIDDHSNSYGDDLLYHDLGVTATFVGSANDPFGGNIVKRKFKLV